MSETEKKKRVYKGGFDRYEYYIQSHDFSHGSKQAAHLKLYMDAMGSLMWELIEIIPTKSWFNRNRHLCVYKRKLI